MNLLSRRNFLLLAPAVFRNQATSLPSRWMQDHHYEAHAVVLLLGVPLLRRRGVGGAWLRMQGNQNLASQLLSFQFAAGSIPSKAAGLNRLGYLEEEVRLDASGRRRANYFGVMTASQEETFEQARQAVRQTGASEKTFVAMRGEIDQSVVRNCTTVLTFDHCPGWPHVDQLAGQCRQSLANLQLSETGAHSPLTFLHALYEAMRSGGEQKQRFCHSGKPYVLHTRARKDPKSGSDFLERGLVEREDDVWNLEGQIHKGHPAGRGAPSSTFQIWYAHQAPAVKPLRFTLKPKSFLKLSFELRAENQTR
ncbi:MAG: hypothetical protein NZV14_03460 [Bryobacteraceae bacterium]|nr:hypothetical protein [Bryobacteraceae bacterium]MDW8377194.1 hypothetical protein [Bryobacterales bacterium]